jgi:Spy/CpxP family protein refolding chaperone
MYRIGALLAGLAAALLLAGDGRSGDKATQPKTKSKSNIDLILSLVKLSKEQRSAIEAIQTTFKKKVDELKKQEEQEIMKLLTPEQRDQIRRVILENLRKDEAKDKKGG